MNVALRQLRAFLAVARHGSFSRGAEEVAMSQSAISLTIRHLETELGVRLLDRTTRQVSLTAIGETLVATSSRLIDELDGALKELRDIGAQRRGRVAVSCVPSVARGLMPRCVEYCIEKWPNVSLSVDDVAASEVLRKVARGETEFGITSGDIAATNLVAEPLMEDRFYVVCRRDHPFARRKDVTWGELTGQRLLMLNNTSGSRKTIDETLVRANIPVEIFLELAQPSSVLGMVEGRLGVAVVPNLATPRRDDSVLTSRRLTKPKVSRTLYLLRRRDRSLSPAASAVWSTLLTLYGGKRAASRNV